MAAADQRNHAAIAPRSTRPVTAANQIDVDRDLRTGGSTAGSGARQPPRFGFLLQLLERDLHISHVLETLGRILSVAAQNDSLHLGR